MPLILTIIFQLAAIPTLQMGEGRLSGIYRGEESSPMFFGEASRHRDSRPGSLASQLWSFPSQAPPRPAPTNPLCSHKGIYGDGNQVTPF